MSKSPYDYKVNEDVMSVKELWEAIAKLSSNVVNDNNVELSKSRDNINGIDVTGVDDNGIEVHYPISIRLRQLETIQVYLNTLKQSHEKLSK